MDIKEQKRKGITMGKAILKLNVFARDGMVSAHVLKARHLSSACSIEPCQSYVQVSLEPDSTSASRCITSTRPHRHPLYNEQFSFELTLPEDHKKRLYVSVWNFYPSNKPNIEPHAGNKPNIEPHAKPQFKQEFMGCMSFGVHHIVSQDKAIDGWYYLLKDGIGRRKHLQAILNSAIYSDVGDVKHLCERVGNDQQMQVNHSNQEELDHRLTNGVNPAYVPYRLTNGLNPAYVPYTNVTQNCEDIIQDITSSACRDSQTQHHYSSPEEDTYTTFVFTKLPLQNNNLNIQNSELPPQSVGHDDVNVKMPPQRPHPEQDENVYVKMYPPKFWRQNSQAQGTDHKPTKHVQFCDAVDPRSTRESKDTGRCVGRDLYKSNELVDISEVDTHGYMSLSHVRREDPSIYASIEPLNGSIEPLNGSIEPLNGSYMNDNGSYMNDNASEISEFTYSKTISRASRTLYPNIHRTPLPPRKMIGHLPSQPRGYMHDAMTSQHSCHSNKQTVTGDVRHNNKVANRLVPRPQYVKPDTPIQTLIPNPEKYSYEYNNIHNDSGIADHDSPTLSDLECSDHGIHFAYKPKQDMFISHATLQCTPTMQRKDAPKIERKLLNIPNGQRLSHVTHNITDTPALQRRLRDTSKAPRHPVQKSPHVVPGDIQVHDTPRGARDDQIQCTNDSCVEENETNRMAHTPSCPYHVCTSCNGIVPHYRTCTHTQPSPPCTEYTSRTQPSPPCTEYTSQRPPPRPPCTEYTSHQPPPRPPFTEYTSHTPPPRPPCTEYTSHTPPPRPPCTEYTSHATRHNGVTEEADSEDAYSHSEDAYSHSEDAYSHSEDAYSQTATSEDGYMSMEKFNVYRDTVLKHKTALECNDHKTTTKIYFL